MTDRLYYTDPYLTTFTAAVTELAEGGRRVYLDRTAFYPTSGGQPRDLGTLAGQLVVDVVDDGDRIAHLLAEPLRPTDSVEGVIDWPRRFDHMQQHTAQHLLSAVLDTLFGARTTSVHFGDETSTVDLDRESLSGDQLLAAEHRANEIVLENRPVAISFEEAAHAEGLRKASRREGMLRIIAIDGVDRSACGGTHVRQTAELGSLLVLGVERVKGQARVEFVAGWRALHRARRNEQLVRDASRMLSVPPGEISTALELVGAQLKEARSALKKVGGEVAAARARRLADAATPDADGVRHVLLSSHDYSADELRALTQAGSCIAGMRFVATLGEPPTVFVGAGPDSGWDAGAVLKAALADVGGRGGGSAKAAQGTVGRVEELELVVKALR